MHEKLVTISVLGVSGKESVKGCVGVGKSLLCNRFVRASYDDFIVDHTSVLSQTDFAGSPVINSDHWLYWGERRIESNDVGGSVIVRVIEQTEFLDDESYEPLAGPSEPYYKRACRVNLESKDKLMYIQKEQLGLEAEYPQHILLDGRCTVDAFIFAFDCSRVSGRLFDNHSDLSAAILKYAIPTKRPIVIAATKFDVVDRNYRKALQQFLARREMRNAHLQVVEVSSLKSVNVDEVFLLAACMALKRKHRLRLLPYPEASSIVMDRINTAEIAYRRLLGILLPIEEWPSQRRTWSRLFTELSIDRHADFINFVHEFGRKAARRLYEQHVSEAREFWISERLRRFEPRLREVFSRLLTNVDVSQMSWEQASSFISSHALFDEYFLTLGTLGKQLEPLSPEECRSIRSAIDNRIPAEILLKKEAMHAFQLYKMETEAESRKDRLEEEFVFLLGDTPQVTPGKPLQDACIFLQGSGIYESLPPVQASRIYDNFQSDLIKKAEADFQECLMENVELFSDLRNNTRKSSLREADMKRIASLLQPDYRFRQLSRLNELRDRMIHSFASFLLSDIQSCAAAKECSDVVLSRVVNALFPSYSATYNIGVTIYGEISMVGMFINDIKSFLRDQLFACDSGFASFKCFYGGDGTNNVNGDSINAQLYLIGSIAAVESARLAVSRFRPNTKPIFVLTCDPAHYDLLPYLHQQGSLLAETANGLFIGSDSSDADYAPFTSHDSNSTYSCGQLIRICRALCSSQLDDKKSDVRVQLSLCCGETEALRTLVSSVLSESSRLHRAIISRRFIEDNQLVMDVRNENRVIRAKLQLSSYHRWIAKSTISDAHGHILVFHARRAASFYHARTALCRVLKDGCSSVSGKSIALVAFDDSAEHGSTAETNMLLTEAEELTSSVGATFILIRSHSTQDLSTQKEIFDFLCRLESAIPKVDSNYASFDRTVNAKESDYARVADLLVSATTSPGSTMRSTASSIGGTSVTSSKSRRSAASTTLSTGAEKIDRTEAPSYESACNMRIKRRAAPERSMRLPLTPRTTEGPPPPFTFPTAPLATPEGIEVAAEYGVVQDALTDDDHIYSTLDFDSIALSPTSPSLNDRKISSTKSSPSSTHNGRASNSAEKALAFSWFQNKSPKTNSNYAEIAPASLASQSSSASLETLCKDCEDGIPQFVRACIDFIEKEGGFATEGLYRVPGNQSQVVELERTFKTTGKLVCTNCDVPVHVVATAVKNFFSALPTALVPVELHSAILASFGGGCKAEVATLKENAYSKLAVENKAVLRYLCAHLEKVAKSSATAMSTQNLSKVWFPTIFRPVFENFNEMSNGMRCFQNAAEFLLLNFSQLL